MISKKVATILLIIAIIIAVTTAYIKISEPKEVKIKNTSQVSSQNGVVSVSVLNQNIEDKKEKNKNG